MSLVLAGGFLTTGPPGKSLFFKKISQLRENGILIYSCFIIYEVEFYFIIIFFEVEF